MREIVAERLAREARLLALDMCYRAKTGHIGSVLSCVDLLAVVLGTRLHSRSHPADLDGDVFILSKGHAAAGLYAMLHLTGALSADAIERYCTDGSPLIGHVNHQVTGVDLSTGSLGHGVAVASGVALAQRTGGGDGRAVVLVSDGELDEGAVWEGALLAGHHGLENLTVIVDHNGIQGLGPLSEIVRLDPLVAKWEAFGWNASEVDGHDLSAIAKAFDAPPDGGPRCILANTTKGRGVPFMENDVHWHYQVLDDEHWSRARVALSRTEP
jgi:transketolase